MSDLIKIGDKVWMRTVEFGEILRGTVISVDNDVYRIKSEHNEIFLLTKNQFEKI